MFDAFKKFFDWWGDLTNTEYKHYNDGKFGVNWPIVTFGLFFMFLMVLLLPGGLLF